MNNILEVRGLKKNYGENVILKDVNFELGHKQIIVIKGRSGCGKSTLLNICSMLETQDDGTILFKGIDLNSYSYIQKQNILKNDIGYIFQDFNLFENMSVYENLYIYLQLVSDISKDQMIELMKVTLSEVGLQNKLYSKVKLLSVGEKQRVAISRTLLKRRNIVFADEPSANVDDENAENMVNIFRKLKEKGTSMIIVSHDDVFDCIADKIYRLEGGILC